MKKYLVCYSTPDFRDSQKRLIKSALRHGIDKVFAFTRKDLVKTKFYQENKCLLDKKRGGGYWLWKPYYILEILNKIDDGDILVYADSGVEIVADLSVLIDLCIAEQGILVFDTDGHKEIECTKHDCFILMDCDSEHYHESLQVMTTMIIFQKNQKNIEIVKKWLEYIVDERLVSDIPSQLALEYPEFVENRHDQSIFSLLTKLNGIPIHRDPSQWGNYNKKEEFRVEGEFLLFPYSDTPMENSNYGTILNHHRKRKKTFKKRIKDFFKIN